MRIAVNTRLLIKNKLEGIGWFTYETLKRITKTHTEHEFFFLFDRQYDKEFIFSDNITPLVIPPQARHPVLFYIWFEHSVARTLKKINADVFLSPDGYLSLRTKVPSLAVIHDLNFEHYPNHLPFLITKYYRYFFPRFARKAKRIATVSNFSKDDIAELYNIESEKIDVVYDGANESFKPINEEAQNGIRNIYTEGKPYFVYVGGLHPRKNLINLFKAFDLYKNKTASETKLLIVGEKLWWTADIKKAYNEMNNKNELIFTGRLQAKELHQVLASALALTYISYFEGFGIPVVEAFRCNVPVITSNVTSMPEIAGDAALLVDPSDVDEIANAMIKISNDNQLRKKLVEKGSERKDIFTWEKSAQRLWKSIEKTL